MRIRSTLIFVLPLLTGLGLFCSALAGVPAVLSLARTETMLGIGDVADDVCVWVHPTQGDRSIIIVCDRDKPVTLPLHPRPNHL